LDKNNKTWLLLATVVLVACFLWPSFQVTTPVYYGRIVCVGEVKKYLREQKEPLENLTTIDSLKAFLERCETGVVPTPTKKRNVVVFNKDYLKSESPDWVLIVLGKDLDSWTHGDLVITKSIESKRVKNAIKLIHGSDNLNYYYLYLSGADRPTPDKAD
jgi:hypothetical protein